jgi:hypothetical protein
MRILSEGRAKDVRTGILDRIGWQQLDLVVRRRDQLDEPLAAIAQETGVKL